MTTKTQICITDNRYTVSPIFLFVKYINNYLLKNVYKLFDKANEMFYFY